MAQGLKDLVSNWIIKAENDLKTASCILNSDEVITDTACFHCQQSAEKYLKAFLVSKGETPEKTHKIERLLESCKKYDSEFVTLEEVIVLSEYAVEFRYPDDFYMPDVDEAKTAFALAVKTKEFILKHIKLSR